MSRGILYVSDMNTAAELVLSVWTARVITHLPIAVISLGLSDPIKKYLKEMGGVQIIEDTWPRYKYGISAKRHVFLHRVFEKTFFVDTDTVFIQPPEETIWQFPANSFVIQRVPRTSYSYEKFLPIHQLLPEELKKAFPMPAPSEYNPVAVQSGAFLFAKDTAEIFYDFFSKADQNVWEMNKKQKCGNDQGFLHFICNSRKIPIIHLPYEYNFYSWYYNVNNFCWGEPIERTYEKIFFPVIFWKEARILHYNVAWPHPDIPKRIAHIGAARGIINLLERENLFSIKEFKKLLSSCDGDTARLLFHEKLPVAEPYKRNTAHYMKKLSRKFFHRLKVKIKRYFM